MFFSIFKTRVRLHARRIFHQIFGGTYPGEVFLCGGAFRPLLKRRAPVNHLELWVRDRKERETLTRFLLARGAALARESQPYCLKLRLDGCVIEISYHNLRDGTLADVLNTFDLAICGIGARYVKGRVAEVHVAAECWTSMRRRSVQVLPSYLCAVQDLHTPTIIRTLHRMGQEASELNYDVDVAHEHLLWDVFWNLFSEEERRAAMEFYFETTVSSRNAGDERLVRRATSGSAPVIPARHPQPLLTPQRA